MVTSKKFEGEFFKDSVFCRFDFVRSTELTSLDLQHMIEMPHSSPLVDGFDGNDF